MKASQPTPESIWTPERQAAALAAAETFRGTPHMQRRREAGRGVDCVQFVIAVLQASGVLPDFQWPQYRQDIGFRIGRNQLGDLMREVFYAESIEVAGWEPKTGDVGIFKCGKTSNHCGIIIGGRFWHVTTTSPTHDVSPRVVTGHLQEVVRFSRAGLKSEPRNLKTS